MILNGRTPSGAWKQLEKRYRPQNTAAICKLRSEMRSANLANLESSDDPLALLAKFETFAIRIGELGGPIDGQTILLDFLHRLTLDCDQEVRQLHAKKTLTSTKVERVIRARSESLESKRRVSGKVLSAGRHSHLLIITIPQLGETAIDLLVPTRECEPMSGGGRGKEDVTC